MGKIKINGSIVTLIWVMIGAFIFPFLYIDTDKEIYMWIYLVGFVLTGLIPNYKEE